MVNTKEDIIEWFTRDGKPLLNGLLNVIEHGNYKSYSWLWNKILDHGYLGAGNNCWISRKGIVWYCSFGRHEFLLDIMGIEHTEPENAGWVRISDGGSDLDLIRVQGKFRPTKRQWDVINHIKQGTSFDNDAWTVNRISQDAPVIETYEKYM